MTTYRRARHALVLPILVLALAACAASPAATPGGTPTQPATTPPPASAPESPIPSAPEADGTITVVDGVTVSGPGGSIADALAAGSSDPYLVNGVLVLDLDGNLWLVDSIDTTAPLAFEGSVLRVVDYPESGAEWDPANAGLTGLKEADGIRYFEDKQVFGVVGA
jgi:hypothetical protein